MSSDESEDYDFYGDMFKTKRIFNKASINELDIGLGCLDSDFNNHTEVFNWVYKRSDSKKVIKLLSKHPNFLKKVILVINNSFRITFGSASSLPRSDFIVMLFNEFHESFNPLEIKKLFDVNICLKNYKILDMLDRYIIYKLLNYSVILYTLSFNGTSINSFKTIQLLLSYNPYISINNLLFSLVGNYKHKEIIYLLDEYDIDISEDLVIISVKLDIDLFKRIFYTYICRMKHDSDLNLLINKIFEEIWILNNNLDLDKIGFLMDMGATVNEGSLHDMMYGIYYNNYDKSYERIEVVLSKMIQWKIKHESICIKVLRFIFKHSNQILKLFVTWLITICNMPLRTILNLYVYNSGAHEENGGGYFMTDNINLCFRGLKTLGSEVDDIKLMLLNIETSPDEELKEELGVGDLNLWMDIDDIIPWHNNINAWKFNILGIVRRSKNYDLLSTYYSIDDIYFNKI